MRRIRTAAAISLVLAGFATKAAAQDSHAGETEEIGFSTGLAARQADDQDVLRVIQAFLDAINNRDTAAYRALVLAEVRTTLSSVTITSTGRSWRATGTSSTIWASKARPAMRASSEASRSTRS